MVEIGFILLREFIPLPHTDSIPTEFRLKLIRSAQAVALILHCETRLARAVRRLRLVRRSAERFINPAIVYTIVQIGRTNRYRKLWKQRNMAKPEKTFKVGPVRASIFRNSIERNGQSFLLPKVVLEVRYKDKSGEWKGTNSLSLNDLPKAVLALESAYAYLLEKSPESAETPSNSPSSFSPPRPSEKTGLFPHR